MSKTYSLANRGMTASETAESLGFTEEELMESLKALKNTTAEKQARDLISKLEANKKRGCGRAKAKKQVASFAAAHPEIEIISITKPTVSKKPAETVEIKPEPAKPVTPATPVIAEKPAEAQKKENKLDSLKSELEAAEARLIEVNKDQKEAEEQITESEQAVRRCEEELQELMKKLKNTKEIYSSEKEKLERAQENLIASEGRKAELEKQINNLRKEFEEASAPQIYISASGEIACENAEIPDANIADWATVIDALPDEIGNQLRRKDAQILIKLRTIEESTGRNDCIFMFDNELLETAYAAYKQI